ncbi:TetR/AcrR family transcriptional regulator [Pseudooceanicola onchidii]|uniref:TetR/AcrR family transcriptional regulator n=1 Tax=Pseudooceanicola onchidii TaxID=2562279 RepID=UPI0010AB0BEE|nr:TetR/AcrR family transcriptional regulator [Pseudooceanicola onchidii]
MTESNDRKQQIIQGAMRALQSQGLPHLSYDTVAEAAGVTRQLIRYHYSDPDTLMKDVCDHLAGIYREALITTAGQLKGPARVDAFLDFYFDLLDGTPKPRDDRIYDAMMSLSATSPVIRKELVGQYRLIGQVLSHEFGVQYPDLTQRSAEELSWLFVCLMYGHWKMVASLGYAEAHRHVSRAAMDRLILSYRETPADPAIGAAPWGMEPS